MHRRVLERSINCPCMIRNYLTTAFCSFIRHRSFTLLNVVGLTLGLVASLLILQYVRYERSFDTFHSKAKDIYRLQYMDKWLAGFPCHISIHPVLFVAAGAGVVFIAFLSVSVQTIRAARVNPAQTLKYE